MCAAHTDRSITGPPVVSGLGVVSAIGVGLEAFWDSVVTGSHGVRPVRAFDTSSFRSRLGCEVTDELLEPHIRSDWRSLPRATQLGVVAASQALEHAGLRGGEVDAVFVGTTMGDLDTSSGRVRKGSPDFAGGIADALGIDGPAQTVATSCSAGNLAVCLALDWIASGRGNRVLAGGAEALSVVAFMGFSRLRALAPERCAPFTAGREGLILGEGAGFVCVESVESLVARGRPALASLLGYGLSCDAHHASAPEPRGRGAAQAMRSALRHAGVGPDQVDYVCAHGTGTVQNDQAEAAAYEEVLGATRPPLSSLKSLTGHTLGAAGAMEIVACVRSLDRGEAIPAWNGDPADSRCPVRLVQPGQTIDGLDIVLNNAFAFGGNNSCLVLSR